VSAWLDVVDIVVTGNVAMEEPAGTLTLAGTKAGAPSVHKSTTMPPAGAGPASITLPVAGAPPTIVTGSTETDATLTAAAGVTLSAPVLLELL